AINSGRGPLGEQKRLQAGSPRSRALLFTLHRFTITLTYQLSPRSQESDTDVVPRLDHLLDRPAQVRRSGGGPQTLGALFPPPGRSGPQETSEHATAGGRRGRYRPERLRQLLAPRPAGPIPAARGSRRPVASPHGHHGAQ